MRTVLQSDGHLWSPLTGDPLAATGLRWVDYESPTDDELHALEKDWHFHPLAVEDCRHLDQRAKLEEYGDHLFVVMHVFAPSAADATQLDRGELHAFLRPGLLVTVHDARLDVVERVRTRALKGDALAARSAGAVLHELMDIGVDDLFPLVDRLVEEADDLAEAVLGPAQPRHMLRLVSVKRAVSELRRSVGPLRDVMAMLCRGNLPGITEQELLYLRNVLDHLYTVGQQLDATRDLILDARDLYLNAQAARVNNIVKRLSLIATLGLPLTTLTGFFGMNFTLIPFDSPLLMGGAFGAMITVPLVLLGLLRWRGWT